MKSPATVWLLAHFAGGLARAQPGRALVQVTAIAIGVCLGTAVNLINASDLAELSAAERSLSGAADLSVIGPVEGFDEALYQRIATDPQVVVAAPLLEVNATVDDEAARADGRASGRSTALRIVGIDALRSALLEPDLVGTKPSPPTPLPRSGRGEPNGSFSRAAGEGQDEGGGRGAALADLLGEGLFVSPAALSELHRSVGDTVTLVVGQRRVDLRIAGELPAARDAIATMDLGAAQWRLDRLGRLSRIDVKLALGADLSAAQRAWQLPAGLRVEHAGAALDRERGLSRAYRVNLDVLSMVALFTGAFLVFSLQSQAVVARKPQLALLRMLGATRAEVLRVLIVEAAAFGTVGALLGLALGAALAHVLLRTLGGDLGGGYFAGLRPHVAFDPLGALLFFALGLAAAVGGTWLPAREAAGQPPAPALKAGVEPAPGSQRPRRWIAAAGFALAAVLLALPPVDEIPLGAYASIGALLVATIALKPLIAPRLIGPLARWICAHLRSARHAPAWLAATRLARLPRFAAVGAAGILASFALMVAMATMVTSFRSSFDEWLDRMLPADLYARAAPAGATARFSAQDLERMRSDPAVARAQFLRTLPLALDPAGAPVVLIARTIDRAHPQATLPLVGAGVAVEPPAIPVWVSEAVADRFDAHPGRELQLPLAGGHTAVTVAGVWRDYVRRTGSIVIDADDYERITGDSSRTDAALWLKAGQQPQQAAQRLMTQLQAPLAQFRQPGQIRALSLRAFDATFSVTYLLEWAAIAIGMAGLAATFSAQAIARTREFGMLRHLGVTRGQILTLLAAEAMLVTLLAAALGLGAGLGVAWILVAIINPQSFHWTMDLRVPWLLVAALAGALLVAAAATSTLAGRRALSIDAVRAVRDDW
ncbi:MAG TPA: ABC transporter permease [Burkholderiaceae bacterium]|nr:ABC transporter permease [Burkholderiaceae bacterium]